MPDARTLTLSIVHMMQVIKEIILNLLIALMSINLISLKELQNFFTNTYFPITCAQLFYVYSERRFCNKLFAGGFN
jgi:hypothetical protein